MDQQLELPLLERDRQVLKQKKAKGFKGIAYSRAFTKTALRQYSAEFIGTLLFVYVGTVVALAAKDALHSAGTNTCIALSFGFGVACMVYATANISGGHLNPAITFAFMCSNNIDVIRGFFYIVSQCLGSIAASGLIRATTLEQDWSIVNGGATTLGTNITPIKGFLLEMMITYMLIFTVFGTVQLRDSSTGMGKLAGLAIGLAVLVSHTFGNSFTGPSMNPARSLGPAIVFKQWNDHWLYWAGPLVAGLLAAVTYRLILKPVDKDKLKAKLMAKQQQKILIKQHLKGDPSTWRNRATTNMMDIIDLEKATVIHFDSDQSGSPQDPNFLESSTDVNSTTKTPEGSVDTILPYFIFRREVELEEAVFKEMINESVGLAKHFSHLLSTKFRSCFGSHSQKRSPTSTDPLDTVHMTTPSRPRNDLFLKGLKTTDNKRDVLAADVRRLTDEEARGAAKIATFTWIETASERELNGWLIFSDQEFIDVKAKGPTTQATTTRYKRLCLEEISENKRFHGILYSKWLARNTALQTPDEQRQVMSVLLTPIFLGALHSARQSFRVFQFWRYRGPKTQTTGRNMQLLYMRRDGPLLDSTTNLTLHPRHCVHQTYLVSRGFCVGRFFLSPSDSGPLSSGSSDPHPPIQQTHPTDTTTKAADNKTNVADTTTKAADTATKSVDTVTPPTGISSK
ncbi:aquaporin-4 [Planoprotostelium fungivorum]|uniref:Aquaporin-4 n=1 Tax=Planoprotostelium fungivorum TaxID=1890364 RepID=A0A2P6N416_9EUKA|nr:aquaporin-4 [Planoprotostelium fungivorum]